MKSLHRVLQRQVARASITSGGIDLEALLQAVSRTYADDERDSRRTDRSIQLMVEELEAASKDLRHASQQLQLTLDSIRHGIMMVDARGIISVCNRKAAELLNLPDGALRGRQTFAELAAALAHATVIEWGEDGMVTAELADGRQVEVHRERAGEQGSVILIEDVTLERERERALRQAETEYRGLFENSVYGIYRDALDGEPLRMNRALVQIYGFDDEQECLAAIRNDSMPIYADPDTQRLFSETLSRDGKITDFISKGVHRKTGEAVWIAENAWYVRDENGKPLAIEGTMLDVTKRIKAEEALHRQANYDSLTGALSRYKFLQGMEEAIAGRKSAFVLYCIDLDMFKDVNDVFGHAAGDELLRAVVRRLDGICGGKESVARLGGDEFAVSVGDDAAVRDPAAIAGEIVAAMRRPFVIAGHTHHIGASVGIAVYPDHGMGSAELLQNADTAMYEAKASGRDGWRLFDQQLRMALERRKAIERGLRSAIARNELTMHLQAVHDVKTGRIAGYESLMRWKSAELGDVSPGIFIPVAEQAGLMAELGGWAIAQACQAASVLGGNLHVSVNLSASQFRSEGLLALIGTELQRHSIKPGRLVLEITESVLVSNQAAAHELISSLDEMGVKIALDDFGTGYSSLSYLQRLPISVVKIDRTFVVGMNQRANAAVLRAVMGIGHDLGITIVAEGVETPEQLEVLTRLGCRYIQGYLLSRPAPLSEAMADLAVDALRSTHGLSADAPATTFATSR
jgi:diguanylate cyclase (GGDEF)-like protein/PAS domain S-box-containing protein